MGGKSLITANEGTALLIEILQISLPRWSTFAVLTDSPQPRSGTFERKPHVTSITYLNHESSPISLAVLSLDNIISSFKQLLKRQLFCPCNQETVL